MEIDDRHLEQGKSNCADPDRVFTKPVSRQAIRDLLGRCAKTRNLFLETKEAGRD